MGKISQGILGGVSGTVGNVVGGSWKGISYLRAKADHYNDANSEKQVSQRSRFKSCVALAQSVLDIIIRPIWNKKAIKMSGYNLFVKNNLVAFDENGDISDFDLLHFSIGDLPLPIDLEAVFDVENEGGIVINWTDNSGVGSAAATDKLNVVVMCNGELFILQGVVITRNQEHAAIALPFASADSKHVYAFFSSAEKGTYSTDKHILIAAR